MKLLKDILLLLAIYGFLAFLLYMAFIDPLIKAAAYVKYLFS